MNVWLDADRLIAYGLSGRRRCATRSRRRTSDVPGGNVTDGARAHAAHAGPLVDARQEFESSSSRRRRRADPARATSARRGRHPRSAARALERRADGGARGASAVGREHGRRHRGVKRRWSTRAELPATCARGDARPVALHRAALHEINVHLVLGSDPRERWSCCAFMRSWRSTLIAAIAIPTSVVATFGAMWALGFTLNSVTMLALVLMVGIVIDDAIVVLENIFRFVEEKGMAPMEAAREATREIGLAVLATTLSLVVIFVPVSFMSSIAAASSTSSASPPRSRCWSACSCRSR
jgi:HAE1 family hydrophobic/amphiphilic exporter-1